MKAPQSPTVTGSIVPDLDVEQSFLRHLRAQNKSPQTITAYSYAVSGLAAFVAEHGMPTTIAGIHRGHVEAYLVELLEHRSPATANNRYRGLARFFAWAVEDGEIQSSPMAFMSPPKIPERKVDVLSPDDMRGLLSTCDPKTFEGRRDAALLFVFCDSGLRLAEVANLRLRTDDGSDVDLDGELLTVTRKGGRTEVASIGAQTVKALDRYIRRRAKHPRAHEGWLWLGTRGRMTGSGIRQMTWRRSAKAGLERRSSPPHDSALLGALDDGGGRERRRPDDAGAAGQCCSDTRARPRRPAPSRLTAACPRPTGSRSSPCRRAVPSDQQEYRRQEGCRGRIGTATDSAQPRPRGPRVAP
jgi:site-specific recombinase XerD